MLKIMLACGLLLSALPYVSAETCTAPGHPSCTITCENGCTAIYWEDSGVCQTSCTKSDGKVITVKLLERTTETKSTGAKVSKTITSSCDKNGNCHNASAGASKATPVQCTKAIGANPGTYTPMCNFYCNPNCGSASLRQGESGNTSGPGTITLICSGQVPLECSLLLRTP